MKIAVATCDQYPDLGLDGQFLKTALRERGIEFAPLVWNEPGVEWGKWDGCLLHSTWDYHLHHAEFLEWTQNVSGLTRLYNPLAAVRWNSHKSYLRDLESRGISVIPTRWLKTGEPAGLKSLLEETGWPRAVMKPAVGASASGTRLVNSTQSTELEEAQAHLTSMLNSGDVMLQPVISSLETYGEHSLIFIEGELTHTVHRASTIKAGEGRLTGENTLITPDQEEVELARRALGLVEIPLLYARVDIVRDDRGVYRVIELEIIEPGLFLRLNPPAAHRLVQGTLNRSEK